LNVNNAIQTARTITFLIQKNKATINDFDRWYAKNVLDRFGGDSIMNWLKESRNYIEKEGDLDVALHVKSDKMPELRKETFTA
jgi:hypothetical protein